MPSATTERRPRRRAALIGLAIAALVIGGGYAATRLLGDDELNPDPPTASPTTNTTTEPTETKLVVAAGEGGSRIAQIDGVTPEGYPDTCEGAVAAATNLTAAFDYNAEGWSTPEGVARHAELVNYFARSGDNAEWISNYKDARGADALSFGGTIESQSVYPGTGAFRVILCAPSTSVVDVIVGIATHPVDEAPDWLGYVSRRVTVAWISDDWVIRSVEAIPLAEDPAGDVQPGLDASDFTPELRAELLAAGGDGWTEYSNAAE